MSLSVAIFAYDYSTSGAAYSGGRYHALLMAHAMAQAGARVSVVVNTVPAARADLPPAAGTPVRYLTTPAYDPADVDGDFDVVVVAPTGAFHPDFYSCAERVAARCGATMAILNYESANWFNRYAPTPDHPEVWDYWRRTVVRGGIVLSSTLEADRYARDYYRADVGTLRFEQCYPPLNSVVADRVPAGPADGSVLYFARPFHDHKGGGDVLAMPPAVFAGRTLRLVFGGERDDAFVSAMRARLATVPGATLEVFNRISDREKFGLIAGAGAVLFPSWFEGFGYPPVEAAYLGTESVCYCLPVLRETLGDVARLVPVGDVTALAAALHDALTHPRPGAELRAAVAGKVGFDTVGARLITALTPAAATLTVHPPADGSVVLWGPWRVEDIDPTAPRPGPLDFPPAPSYATGTPAPPPDGGVTLTVVTWSLGVAHRADIRYDGTVLAADDIVHGVEEGAWLHTTYVFRLPPAAIGRELTLGGYDEGGVGVHGREKLRVSSLGAS